jgi:antitoxin CptB
LRWLLRRGMKELDVLTERYYTHRYAAAPAAERAAFVALLQQTEDPDLWSWVMDQSPVPAEYRDVVVELRRHR